MALGQNSINPLAVPKINGAFLARLKRKVSSRNCSCRQEFSKKHVAAKVHVMVAIYAIERFSIYSLKFIYLTGNHVLERSYQTRVINHLGKSTASQVTAN